jgi:ABC-type nickel/cobalt efflux system permease component RcnA
MPLVGPESAGPEAFMISLLSIIALGFFLGMRHATDPDHVVAVSTIVSRHRSVKHAALIGGLWGIGHTVTILLVGGGIILFGWVIPARIGLSMEFSVGLMLILLGILNLTGILRWITDNLSFLQFRDTEEARVHSHAHGASVSVRAREHVHDPEAVPGDSDHTSLGWFDRPFGRLGLYNAVRPLVVGLVHGLAGSAAVALLVLTTIQNPKWAVGYLLLFGIGTIAGMMVITGAIGAPFAYAGKRSRLSNGLRVASGVISLVFGLIVVYQIGFVDGLFTHHPHWMPR